MTQPMAGGRRRIDRVLGEGFLDSIEQREMSDVRDMRREAEQEEADLSYVRRMLQGRMDILRAELSRRSTPGDANEHIIAHLARVLADSPTRNVHGMGRFLSVEPSRVDEHRREVEQVVADVGISDVEAQTDEELQAALDRVRDYESKVSDLRRRVQNVMDMCTAEIGRRYKEGAVTVDDLLSGR
ncbi:MAG: aerial mycelium formation protein [Actinomycetota bacterium]|nr:aerial mycelium formation protein [Actinomycetota bacterium]